jgi:nitrogen fixation-related uncharacterized protein
MKYQLVVTIMALCIISGIVLWMLALRWFENDSQIIKEILNESQDPKRKKK